MKYSRVAGQTAGFSSFIFGRRENHPNAEKEKAVRLRKATCEKQPCEHTTIADFSNLLYNNLSLLPLPESLMGFRCSPRQKWDTPSVT